MSTLSDLKAKIVSILDAIAEVGVVNDYERWTNRYIKFLAFYKPSGEAKINGCEVSRILTSEEQEATGPRFMDQYVFVIRYYYSLDDTAASEKALDEIIELIRAAFRANRNLDGLCLRHEFIQVTLIEPRFFSNVLCHYVEMNLTVNVEV